METRGHETISLDDLVTERTISKIQKRAVVTADSLVVDIVRSGTKCRKIQTRFDTRTYNIKNSKVISMKLFVSFIQISSSARKCPPSLRSLLWSRSLTASK
jgi:hypothetical protein